MTKSIIRVAIATAAILLIPLVLQLTVGTGVDGEGFNWELGDFVVMGTLLFVVGLTIETTRKITKPMYRGLVVTIILLVFLLIWAELAVGVFGTPFAGS